METNQKPITVEEILKDVCRILGDIDVPVAKLETIGIPIAKSINGINICLEAICREQKKEEEPEITISDPEIVPAEASEDNA